jgi:signal transduction histidine kinase
VKVLRTVLNSYGDIAFAIGLAALGICEIFVPALRSDFHGPQWVNVTVVVLIAQFVAWRRRAPFAAFAIYVILGTAWLDAVYRAGANLPLEPFVVLLILVYTAASRGEDRRNWAVAGVLGILAISELILIPFGDKSIGNVIPGLVFIGLTFTIGRVLGRRIVSHHQLEDAASRAVAQAEERAALAVSAERARIARELHDVVAHAVSLMVVQAGAGERLLVTRPDEAATAFRAIRQAGTEAIDELRRMLGLIDGSGGQQHRLASQIAPQPRLARLDALVDDVRATGLEVRLTRSGDVAALAPGVDLAAYRIVQEALTNTRKHAAGATHADVSVACAEDELVVQVVDDGRPADGRRAGGRGLIGMRERVALYGGSLRAEAGPAGGFVVRARFPLPTGPT